MKTILAITLSVLLANCAVFQNAQNYLSPASAQSAAALVTTNVLAFAPAKDQPTIAAYVYGIAQGIRTLSGGAVPTPDQLNATINLFTKNANVGKWGSLGVSIGSIWGGVYPQIQGNTKTALQYLEAIAQGCETAAQPYLKTS